MNNQNEQFLAYNSRTESFEPTKQRPKWSELGALRKDVRERDVYTKLHSVAKERTIDTLRSVLPAAYRDTKIDESFRSVDFDLGCEHDENGREVYYRGLHIRERDGRIREVSITYPDPVIIEAIVELVLAAMPPVKQEPESEE